MNMRKIKWYVKQQYIVHINGISKAWINPTKVCPELYLPDTNEHLPIPGDIATGTIVTVDELSGKLVTILTGRSGPATFIKSDEIKYYILETKNIYLNDKSDSEAIDIVEKWMRRKIDDDQCIQCLHTIGYI